MLQLFDEQCTAEEWVAEMESLFDTVLSEHTQSGDPVREAASAVRVCSAYYHAFSFQNFKPLICR
jgi:hypothetical protein